MSSGSKFWPLPGHVRVLLGSLAVAAALWACWLFWWGGAAHRQMVKQVVFSSAAASSPDREHMFSEFGQTGDNFGGLNTLLTAIAGAIVFWAGYLQKEQLNQAKADANAAELEAKAERDARQRQEFEALFFRLLSLTREVTARVETPQLKSANIALRDGAEPPTLATVPARKGDAALGNFAARIARNWTPTGDAEEQLRRLVHRYMRKVYNRAPSALGPYFRMLYQTFKLVDESGLKEPEQIRYANIARAQISEGAVLLLALNGWGLYGRKFVPLIEKFGLLEHMHPAYRETFRDALNYGYRRRAFLGKDDRSRPGNEWNPEPLRAAFASMAGNSNHFEDNSQIEDDFEIEKDLT